VVPTRPRFPSLAAFERRPGHLDARGELSDGAGIRNPSHKRSYLRAKPGNGGLMAPATRNYLTVIKAKFKITGGAGYNSYNPL
jgi:hypothetical protein